MVEIELCPGDVLIFEVERVEDTVQSTTAISCSSLDDDSIVIFEVQTNCPSRYLLFPSTGILHGGEVLLITVELNTGDLGLVPFLYTLPGDFLLFDQVFIHADVVSGQAARDFCDLPTKEGTEAIMEHFFVSPATFRKDLLVEYHFSESLLGTIALFSPPKASSVGVLGFATEEVTHLEGDVMDEGTKYGNEGDFEKDCSTEETLKHQGKVRQQSKSAGSNSLKTKVNKKSGGTRTNRGTGVKQSANKTAGVRVHSLDLPAALNAHSDWTAIGTAQLEKSCFCSKSALLDNFLSQRINAYVTDVRHQLHSKLSNMGFEVNELNVFSLLLSSGMEYIIEYLNESLSRKGFHKTSTHEFRRFLGTFMLLSSINLSIDTSWDLMEKITSNKVMSNERFNEIIQNLRGFEVGMRFADVPSARWCDQKDKLQHFHFLEERMFERCRGIFFPRGSGGCYVLDDELISSKAADIELKTVSGRKSGKEGSIVDVICDAFFQILLGMRLRTTSNSQEENVKQLLCSLPRCNNSYNSPYGAILACDRGYGKMSLMNFFMELNFKVITVCSAVGSGHPIIPESELNKFINRKQNMSDFDSNAVRQQLVEFTILDDEDVLRGPEIQIASCDGVGQKTLHAIAYRDIFDKKKAQKILRFFAAGFSNMENSLGHWAYIGKAHSKAMFPTLFVPYRGINNHCLSNKLLVEEMLSNVAVLTQSQRTAEWFTLRAFHLTATMAGILFNSNYDNKSDAELLNQLAKSWFSRTRSTQAMVIGAKNEGMVLKAFSKLSYVRSIFDVGLLENNTYPWMAASPDGVAVVGFKDDENIVASIEIKTRVAFDRIEHAEEIASKYKNKLIVCDIGDDTWNDCVEAEHATQVLLQLWVMNLQTAFYIVATPGTTNAWGKIIYIVMGRLGLEYANDFFDKHLHRMGKLLITFYRALSLDELLIKLPQDLDTNTISMICTRWPFFMAVRKHAIEETSSGFPPTTNFKTSFQVLYNSLKGGLDANTEQMASITPGVKVGFEQKYVLRLITALVTNSWRSVQLLKYGNEIESMTYTKTKQAVNRNGVKLKDFVFHLAMALIRSADERMYYIDRPIHSGRDDGNNTVTMEDLPFQGNESTLMDRLDSVKWPMRFKLKHFNKNRNLVELRLTHSKQIQHEVVKLVENHGKNHCSYCYHRQTSYGCNLCKVFLCKTAKNISIDARSCFKIWHSVVDLVEERQSSQQHTESPDNQNKSSTMIVETRMKRRKRDYSASHDKPRNERRLQAEKATEKRQKVLVDKANEELQRIFRFDGKDYESYQDMVQAKRDRNRKVLQESGLLETAKCLKKYSAKQQAVRVHCNAEAKTIDDDDADEFSEVIKPRYQVAKAKGIYGHEKVDFDRMSKESFARNNLKKDDELASTETEEDEEEE